MIGPGLKLRYVLAVTGVGVLLTIAVALVAVDSLRQAQVALLVAAGIVVSLLAGGITALILTRIDRALIALMGNARRIGDGRYAEPVPVSGVAEVAALEKSLEEMRRALADTAVSRDYLADV